MAKTKSSADKGFTLVELIVVIVVLAILATIAFLSFSGQSASARDSTRLADMSNIAKGLSINYTIGGKYPMPDSKVDITASGATLNYQGFAGASVLGIIKLSDGGRDPLDRSTYYTYATNSAQSRFQLLGFLEDRNNAVFGFSPDFADTSGYVSAIDTYSGRFVVTKGDPLGILLSPQTMVPIQETGNGADVLKTNTSYIAQYTNDSSVTGTGLTLSKMVSYSRSFKTCKEIYATYGSSATNGYYSINPSGKKELDAYCDMISDGGGWTRVVFAPFALTPDNPKKNYKSGSYYSQYEDFTELGTNFTEMGMFTNLGKYSKCSGPRATSTIGNLLYLCAGNQIVVDGTTYTQDLNLVCYLDSSNCKAATLTGSTPTSGYIGVKNGVPIYSSGSYGLMLGDISPKIITVQSNFDLSRRWCAAPISPDVITGMAGGDLHGCNSNQNQKFWGKNTVSMLTGSNVTDSELSLMLR